MGFKSAHCTCQDAESFGQRTHCRFCRSCCCRSSGRSTGSRLWRGSVSAEGVGGHVRGLRLRWCTCAGLTVRVPPRVCAQELELRHRELEINHIEKALTRHASPRARPARVCASTSADAALLLQRAGVTPSAARPARCTGTWRPSGSRQPRRARARVCLRGRGSHALRPRSARAQAARAARHHRRP